MDHPPALSSTAGASALFAAVRTRIPARSERREVGERARRIGAVRRMDAEIVIRTFVAGGGRVTFSVGGGIVADSEPENEYQETLHKARALIHALAGAVTTP